MPADGGRGREVPTHQDAVYGGPIDWDSENLMEPTDPGQRVAYRADLDAAVAPLEDEWVDFPHVSKPRGPISPRAERGREESTKTKTGIVPANERIPLEDPWADGFYSRSGPWFPRHPAHIDPEALRAVSSGEMGPRLLRLTPESESLQSETLEKEVQHPEQITERRREQRRAMGRRPRDSKLYEQVLRDAAIIVDSRVRDGEDGTRILGEKLTVPSVDVFFRFETIRLQQERGWDRKMEFPSEYVKNGHWPYVSDLPRLPDEIIEDELRVDFDLAFQPFVKELKEMKERGESEGAIFKKILDDVRSFPYRKTANSLVKALAGRIREGIRTKRGFIYELSTAFERPGLNCEGRAKLFCALLEAAGYDPETEIFLNWPKNHVQTLLKKKDGTYLAFEGNGFRPFIQRFRDSTDGVCSLQEWKYTLYGVPTAKVIESEDISEPDPEFVVDEDTMDPEIPTPETLPEEEPWKESALEIKVAETVEQVSAVVSDTLAGVFGLFAGKPNEAERVPFAYPEFAPLPISESSSEAPSVETPAEQEAQERRLARVAHSEALKKLLEPKIAAMQKVWKDRWPVGVGTIGPACFFAYGALFGHQTNEQRPPTENEITDAQNEWKEAAEAVGEDMEVRIVAAQIPDRDWETQLKRASLDSPYTYGEFELIPDAYYGAITETETADGRMIHTVHVGDDVRVILPNAFRAMVERDVRAHVESGQTTQSLWVIEGSHLNIAATQRALSQIPRKGKSSVALDATYTGSTAFVISETWVFQNQHEMEQVQIGFAGLQTDRITHTERWGDRRQWNYEVAETEAVGSGKILMGLAKVSGHELKKEFGTSDYYAPVNAIPLAEKEERASER